MRDFFRKYLPENIFRKLFFKNLARDVFRSISPQSVFTKNDFSVFNNILFSGVINNRKLIFGDIGAEMIVLSDKLRKKGENCVDVI